MKEEKITIREYTEKDNAFLFQAFDEFGDYLVEVDSLKATIKRSDYAEYFLNRVLSFIFKMKGFLYIAEMNGEQVGFIAGRINNFAGSVESPAAVVGRMEEFFVKEAFRNRGVGKRLMETAEDFLKKAGCERIYVEVFAPNESAYNFYKGQGYINRDIDMVKEI